MLHRGRTMPLSNLLPISTWHNGVSLNIEYIKYRLSLHPNTVNIAFITDVHVGCEYGVRFNAYSHNKDIDTKNTSVDRGRGGSFYNNKSKTNRLDRACVALKKISEQKKIDCIVLGGDYISNTTSTTEDNAKKGFYEVNTCISKLKNTAPILICKGNHDSNTLGGFTKYVSNDAYTLLIYNNIPKSSLVVYGNENREYGYWDDTNKKLRVIWLNCGDMDASGGSSKTGPVNPQYHWYFSQSQLEFLINALKITESGWKVITFSHFNYIGEKVSVSGGTGGPADSATEPYADAVAQIIASFRHNSSGTYSRESSNSGFSIDIEYDFTKNGDNTFLGFFCGHYHSDGLGGGSVYAYKNNSVIMDDVASSYSLRFILRGIKLVSLCTNDAFWYEGNGTITSINSTTDDSNATVYESCFTILSIDVPNNKIYLNRYGGGFSWEIVYDNVVSSSNTGAWSKITRTVRVTVLDNNSNPISNATVVLRFNGVDVTYYTNENGIAEITGLPIDKFKVIASAEGYNDKTSGEITSLSTSTVYTTINLDNN